MNDASPNMGQMHILVGIHTAGKTSLGQSLTRNGFLFFPEVAVEFIVGRMPWQLPPSFDDSVMTKEAQRDSQFRFQSQPFFVETWHIGNLSYARVRNPEIASKYAKLIHLRVKEFRPRIYFLTISPEILCTRTTYFGSKDRDHAIEFFSLVQSEMRVVLEPFHENTIELNADHAISALHHAVLQSEQQHCIRSGDNDLYV